MRMKGIGAGFLAGFLYSAIAVLLVGVYVHGKAGQVISPHFQAALPDSSYQGVDGTVGKEVSFAQTYREGDIWFGVLYSDYVINASTTLSLAFKSMAQYIYTAPFLTTMFASNPWLKYSTMDFGQKQALVRRIQDAAKSKSLFSKKLPEAKVAELLTDLFLKRVTTRLSRLFGRRKKVYKKMRTDLMGFLHETGAAKSAADIVLGNNTELMFTWVDSIRKNPIATVNNVVKHAFENGLRGFAGMAEWELNQGCFAVAQQAKHIVPMANLFPGGILGKIMQKLVRSYVIFFHPVLANFKGLVSLFLALLCKIRFPKIMNALFNAIFRAKRRVSRALRKFWAKMVGMRGDFVGKKLIEDLMTGSGAVMITLLFQLHAVDIDAITRRGEAVESGLLAGPGVWALSDGLYVGLKDFGGVFKAYFNRYAALSSGIVYYCNQQKVVSLTEDQLDEFFNGENQDEIPPRERLAKWCTKNRKYVNRLQKKLVPMASNFLKHVVRALKQEMKYFSDFFANLLAIFYEFAFSTLEGGIASTINSNFGRAPYQLELDSILRRRQQTNPPQKDSEMPRSIFRKPWMKIAVTKLAHGYFEAAHALTMRRFITQTALKQSDVRTMSKKTFTKFNEAAKLIQASLATMLGRFLNSQAVVTRDQGQTTRMKMYEFINKCQDPSSPGHDEVCGSYVTTNVDEVKFVANSMLAINLGITLDSRDLLLSGPLEDTSSPSFVDPTEAFTAWGTWLAGNRWPIRRGKEFLLYAQHVDSIEKIRPFLEALRSTLQDRLRFSRYDQDGRGALRLFDYHGRSLIFVPTDARKMLDDLKKVRPDPLEAPATFEVLRLNEGILRFSSNRGIAFQGTLVYADDRKELREIQYDPIAIKELLTAQLLNVRGRLGGEMVATMIMVLHRNTPSFHKHSFSTFLDYLSPKLFYDGMLAFAEGHQQQMETSISIERSLYTFPMSFQTFKDIFFNSLNTTVLRMHSVDASDTLSIFVVGLLHYAYQKIVKNRTGRTLVLQHFQRGLLYVMRAIESEGNLNSFPECAFLVPESGVDDVVGLKCGLYRFLKLRSLLLTQAVTPKGQSSIKEATVIVYLDAAVEYLERIKGQKTSWASFLNYGGFRSTAELYAETMGEYSFEGLQSQLESSWVDSPDVLDQLRSLMDPSLGSVKPPAKNEGTAAMLERLWTGTKDMVGGAKQNVRKALSELRSRMRSILGHSSIPEPLRLFNAISGSHFFGMLEYAEFRAYPDTAILPDDFLKASDLSIFGRIILTFETANMFLDNPKHMSDVITQMRIIPFIAPESEELYREIEEAVQAMRKEDVMVAVGWLLSFNIGKGLAGSTIALGLLSLAKVRFATSQITHEDKIGILRVLDPDTLRFIRKALLMPEVFKQMRSFSSPAGTQTLRFAPTGTMVGIYPSTQKYLPLNEKVNIVEVLSRLTESQIGLALQQQYMSYGTAGQGETPLEAGCRILMDIVKSELNTQDDEKAYKLWSRSPTVMDKRLPPACVLFYKLRYLLSEGRQHETTVQGLVDLLYYDGTPVSDYLKFIGAKRGNELERQKQLERVGPVFTSLYVGVVSGNLEMDVTLMGYNAETSHLVFHSRSVQQSPKELPLYELCHQVTMLLMDEAKEKPEIVQVNLSSYYAEEWLRFLEEKKMRQFVEESKNTKIGIQRLKSLSSVYAFYDITDYFFSLRQRSVFPVSELVKASALALVTKQNPTMDDYGLAMMAVDMSERIAKAKIKCYEHALKEYEEYVQKDREAQEMWKADCVHADLIDNGSLGFSAAAITEEQKDLLIQTLDATLAAKCEEMYNALIRSKVDHDKLLSQAWKFITFPHNSLNTSKRFLEMHRFIGTLADAVKRQLPWTQVSNFIAEERKTKTLTRSADAVGKRHSYSFEERPYLFNPFMTVLDFLIYVKTNKSQRLRMPKTLLMKRAQVLAKLPFMRRQTPPRYKEYQTRVEATKDTFFQ